MKKNLLKTLCAALALCTICSLFSCCKAGLGEKMDFNNGQTIMRIEYHYSSGTMMGQDFSIDVCRDRISSADFFSEQSGEMQHITELPISEQQWKQLEDAVLALSGVISEQPQSKESFLSEAWRKFTARTFHILDGGDSRSFYLTLQQTDGSQQRVSCAIPSDRRFMTLLQLLQETANPTGREITYYEAPVLCGILVVNKGILSAEKYSYQITVDSAAQGQYSFFSRYTRNGQELTRSLALPLEYWQSIYLQLAQTDIEQLQDGSLKRSRCCTLYYSDGTQRTVNPSADTMDALQAILSLLCDTQQ